MPAAYESLAGGTAACHLCMYAAEQVQSFMGHVRRVRGRTRRQKRQASQDEWKDSMYSPSASCTDVKPEQGGSKVHVHA